MPALHLLRWRLLTLHASPQRFPALGASWPLSRHDLPTQSPDPLQTRRYPRDARLDSDAGAFYRPTTPSSWDTHRDQRILDRNARPRLPGWPEPPHKSEWRWLHPATSAADDLRPKLL